MSDSNAIQVFNSLQIKSDPNEWTPPYSAASAISSPNCDQLESVILNFNRICCKSEENYNRNWLNSFYDLMKCEWTRFRSFHCRQSAKWTLKSVSPEELARAGFFFLYGDKVQCAFCRGTLINWEEGDDPLSEHTANLPGCPFILGMDVGNQPIDVDPIRRHKKDLSECSDINIWFTQLDSKEPLNKNGVEMVDNKVDSNIGPKNAVYESFDSRFCSFMTKDWCPSVPMNTRALAEAGLYSIGVSDVVKCFHCGYELYNWELGDDPWIEHAKWSPNCQFVLINKGPEFIEQCRRLTEREELLNDCEAVEGSDSELYSPVGSDSEDEEFDSLGINTVNQWMDSDIVFKLMDLNAFSDEVIKAVLYKRWREKRQPFTSFPELYDTVSQFREPPNLKKFPVITKTLTKEEYNSGDEPPAPQSSMSSTTSSLSTNSFSSQRTKESISNESSPKPKDDRLLCKLCFEREIGIVFLPCGHQLSCTQCDSSVTDCPVCHKLIRGTVRTFFS